VVRVLPRPSDGHQPPERSAIWSITALDSNNLRSSVSAARDRRQSPDSVWFSLYR
jgi:hypothetical protein